MNKVSVAICRLVSSVCLMCVSVCMSYCLLYVRKCEAVASSEWCVTATIVSSLVSCLVGMYSISIPIRSDQVMWMTYGVWISPRLTSPHLASPHPSATVRVLYVYLYCTLHTCVCASTAQHCTVYYCMYTWSGLLTNLSPKWIKPIKPSMNIEMTILQRHHTYFCCSSSTSSMKFTTITSMYVYRTSKRNTSRCMLFASRWRVARSPAGALLLLLLLGLATIRRSGWHTVGLPRIPQATRALIAALEARDVLALDNDQKGHLPYLRVLPARRAPAVLTGASNARAPIVDTGTPTVCMTHNEVPQLKWGTCPTIFEFSIHFL